MFLTRFSYFTLNVVMWQIRPAFFSWWRRGKRDRERERRGSQLAVELTYPSPLCDSQGGTGYRTHGPKKVLVLAFSFIIIILLFYYFIFGPVWEYPLGGPAGCCWLHKLCISCMGGGSGLGIRFPELCYCLPTTWFTGPD